ncbi:SURF1 family protein [Psychromarinibacter sp. C21-152]|uniref:SURF1-like protein n=1 Tax=Psychromarinibacter sediminicola TaxID=3033385 RepID=A0AAE3T9N1_9RHOB|nr:SURF1 family protein [Psychromarinibacter sediminicola]MDF0602407.1 SURF1 family protein [Psychromarinibacter sediminicola]
MKRIIVPLLIGVVGVAILVSLGAWQVRRLAWKEDMLARIEAQIGADPVPLFSQPLEEYQAVTAEGTITGEEAHVLASVKGRGAVFRIVAAFETEGRRVLLDRGWVPEAEKDADRPQVEARIVGNFRTVEESDGFTPEPDLEENYWFARDVDRLAEVLDTEPILIVLRATSEDDPPVTPWPVGTEGIPNDHLNYAITWFSLAVVWAGMTGLWLWRITRRAV